MLLVQILELCLTTVTLTALLGITTNRAVAQDAPSSNNDSIHHNTEVSMQAASANNSSFEASNMTIDQLLASPSPRQRSKNYASYECAKVVETNPEAKHASNMISEMIDEYMLNPCKASIWFVIELCEIIQATHIEIANYELFSSTPKDFTVYFSDTYPASDWKLVGQFTATDSRSLQAFELKQLGFGKFIRVELHSHHGKEHYCPISVVKIYGASMVDEYENENRPVQDGANNGQNNLDAALIRHKRRTSAYRVYKNMITDVSPKCGLSPSTGTCDNARRDQNGKSFISIIKDQLQPAHTRPNVDPQPTVLPSPQPTQSPPTSNKTTPLKPSIFVELSNKVKALETSLKVKIDDIDRRIVDLDQRFNKYLQEPKTDQRYILLTLIVIAYCVYKLMLDLM